MNDALSSSSSSDKPRRSRWLVLTRVLPLSCLVIAVLCMASAVLWFVSGKTGIQREVLTLSKPSCGAWEITGGPGLGGHISDLRLVTALSSTDIWAVGRKNDSSPPVPFSGDIPFVVPLSGSRPFALHWDGPQWSNVDLPVGRNMGNIEWGGISSSSSHNIWVVGRARDEQNIGTAYIIRWDGSAWSDITSPVPAATNVYLSSVAALAPGDVWVAGKYEDTTGKWHTLLTHWDGRQWSTNQRPGSSSLSTQVVTVNDMKALTTDNIWAIGYYIDVNSNYHNIVLNWDGQTWRIVPASDDGSGLTVMTSIDALSTSDVWIVGTRGLAMHWDGSTWMIEPTPYSGLASAYLYSVAAVASNNVWAVGSTSYENPVVLHWNGQSWADVTEIEEQARASDFVYYDVVSLPSGELWTVGGTPPMADRDLGPRYSVVGRFRSMPCAAP